MSDEQVTQEEAKEDTTDYKALYEKTQTDLAALAAHQEKLLSETKAAKKEKAEQAALAAKAAQEKAEKEGQFENLWKSEQAAKKALEDELIVERNNNRQEKISSHAMKLAVELADGDAPSAKLLAKFIGDSISKMADERGSLDDSVLQAVKKEFSTNSDYAPLLSGSKAKGGGALGSGYGVAKSNTISRDTFNTMDAGQQRDFIIKQRGSIVD